MLPIFDSLRDVNSLSIAVRMVLAVICGGSIGIERGYKRRPAGFRTHVLICLGAAMTTLTSQYLYLEMHYYTDMARLGAQVIAGVGFIGAGTIIVTRHQRVKGLTTAAGLWGSAIIGLALGSGFYEGGILTTALILLAELLFSKWEYRIMSSAPEVNLYVEYNGRSCLESMLKFYREQELKLIDMEITRHAPEEQRVSCVIFTLRLNKKMDADWLIAQLYEMNGIIIVEEL
ncbi:MAG: MgtC/SapB family protein [Lawsonibacter sp.]